MKIIPSESPYQSGLSQVKRTSRTLAALFLMLTLMVPNWAAGALSSLIASGDIPSLAPMLETIRPAIVNISTTTRINYDDHPLLRDPMFRRFFNIPEQRNRSSSLGSGVVVDANRGHILTNHHVIDKADEILVTTEDGREFTATVVGTDQASDVAVIRVEPDNLTEIQIGISEHLRVGDFVVAIGNPFGLSQTVTSGIVSGLGRSGLGIGGYEDFIQTDASINPGNSGGALVNLRGELIGINTAIFSRTGGSIGIGLSIPIDMAMSIMEQIVEHGNIKRGILGVRIQDMTPALAEAFDLKGHTGAIIVDIVEGTVADEAGLQEGDIVIRLNNNLIESSSDLRNAIGLIRPGNPFSIEYFRDGVLYSEEITIKGRDDGRQSFGKASLPRFEGAEFVNSTDRNYGQVVVIESIEPGSTAASSGLVEDDIILNINRQRITDVNELKNVVQSARGRLLIQLIRDGNPLFLGIRG
ncbi:MAG: Do family serine endopeptidase [Gammaproteobacteria bacterium]|nr:Do family serine endopeptidase [Gammaproteobacteria bacterium]MCY4219931.1 Do family serine endopeptidase [Gammaproteobacteria bacterium]MCY4275679.1 Do family serine endopeptidase [Gammaproteobacteria bacterium]